MSAATGFHEEEALGKAYDARLMRRLLKYMRPYKAVTLAAILFILLAAAVQISLGFITRWGINEYIKFDITYELIRSYQDTTTAVANGIDSSGTTASPTEVRVHDHVWRVLPFDRRLLAPTAATT